MFVMFSNCVLLRHQIHNFLIFLIIVINISAIFIDGGNLQTENEHIQNQVKIIQIFLVFLFLLKEKTIKVKIIPNAINF